MNKFFVGNVAVIIFFFINSPHDASASTVEINFTANITYINAGTYGPSLNSDESWIEQVNSHIFVGDKITGTLTYHTNPQQFTQYYYATNPNGTVNTNPLDPPYFASAQYLADSLVGLTLNLPSAGLTWSTGPQSFGMNFVQQGKGADNLRAWGDGTSKTFPELLYRGTVGPAYGRNQLDLSMYTNVDFPVNEISLVPITNDNLVQGYGSILMDENLWDEGVGDHFNLSYSITDVHTRISSVPLPGSVGLLMPALIGLFTLNRSRRKRQ